MSNADREEWVVVAEFNTGDWGFAADMAVSKLQVMEYNQANHWFRR